MSEKNGHAEDLEIAAFRLPKTLRSRAKARARAEDLTFSQLMRRAIRRELIKVGEVIGGAAK
jgi:hypothetical protein